MSAKKAGTLTREELWRENVLEMKRRWPKSKVNSYRKLAFLAEVTGPYVSRLENFCPKTDDPSPELCRLCAVLGVTPSSLLESHLETVAEVTLDPIEAAKRVAPFRAASRTPTKITTSDTEIIEGYSKLDADSKRLVKELITRLAPPGSLANRT